MGFSPKHRLLHYELTDRLGRGGMGEVWRARDTRLDRDVAIKVLPERVARDPERLARLEREAKAVARLSHPNIVTVHSVEETEGIRFVTMEFVRGRPLAEMIPGSGLPLDRLFEFAIPIADAVAAAHRQGVVHRDLKPGNVMVDDDGRVKVLDFGLAKIADPPPSDDGLDDVPTETVTAEGRILGTAAYMSPEQAEGKAVDPRTDVFSLGVMLFEMSTGRRPFRGDTPASTVSAILRDTPPSVTELNRSLPRHLGRIVKRCLAKNPERRYQTAIDLRNELQELREEVDGGAEPAPEGSVRPARLGRRRIFGVVAGAVALVVLGFLGREMWPGRSNPRSGGASLAGRLEMRPLTQSGTVVDAGISPDGRTLAYVAAEEGRHELRVKQIAIGSDRQVLAPTDRRLGYPTVSPDGEYVYYLAWDPSSGAVERIPVLGGPPEKVFGEAAGNFALSPDGRRIAFLRGTGESRAIFIGSVDGSEVRQLGDEVGFTRLRFAWSADGDELIVGDPFGPETRLEVVSADGGARRTLGNETWTGIFAIAAVPDGRGLLLSGQQGERNYHHPAQIWFLGLPGLDLRRVTSDFNSYSALSLDRSGRRLVAVQERSEHSLWILPGLDASEARKVAFTSQSGPYWAGVAWLPDGRLLYEDLDGEDLQIWAARLDGTGRQRLTQPGGFNMGAAVSGDGSRIAYFSDRAGRFRIWLSDADGTDARPLTSGEPFGEEVFPQFSPDGRWVYYHVLSPESGEPRIRRAPAAGGPSSAVFDGLAMFPAVSPEGNRVAFTALDPADRRFKIVVTDLEGGRILAKFGHEYGGGLFVVRWTPDGKGVAATSPTGPSSNIVVHPLDGGPARQITRFTEGTTLGFGWSPDGTSLAVVLGKKRGDAVLITGFLPRPE